MTDLLRLTVLVQTRIGVPSEERSKPQELQVTIELPIDASAVASKDTLEGSIDYALLIADLQELSKTERKTIERFAEDSAAMILKRYRSSFVRVTVVKHPPLEGLLEARVTVERRG